MAKIQTNAEYIAFWHRQAERYDREAEKATSPADLDKWQRRAAAARQVAATAPTPFPQAP
jgi:hypothetical protein